MTGPFYTVPSDAIAEGVATDAYFERTEETLEHAGRDPHVVAEVTADQFPTGSFDVLAGVHEVGQLLADRPVAVDALPEGALFDGGPVLTIEGPYRSFARFETAILGMLSQASAYATKALAARVVGDGVDLFSFGSRHVHPALATVVERSALVGGFDGFSNVAAGERLGREAGGTMPHSLMLLFGPEGTVDAWAAFDAAVDPGVPRIALCDTFTDERVESLAAAEALGDALDGVRLDTTASRRGDFEHIVREVRWELEANGYEAVDILVSGGIDLETIDALAPLVAGFGVGSFITDAAPLDLALDIVEVDGEATAKRGKLSGRKAVYRTPEGGHRVTRAAEAGVDGEALLRPLVRDGAVVPEDDLDAAAALARADAEAVGFDPWAHA